MSGDHYLLLSEYSQAKIKGFGSVFGFFLNKFKGSFNTLTSSFDDFWIFEKLLGLQLQLFLKASPGPTAGL